MGQMTRRDYQLLADTIGGLVPAWRPVSMDTYAAGYYSALTHVVRDLAAALAEQNKHFDPQKFIADCGIVAKEATKE